MVVLNQAKNAILKLIIGSDTIYPQYFLLGTGSSTLSASNTELVDAQDRQLFTETTYPTSQKVKWQGDWNAVEISGLTLQEFGVIPSGTGVTGSIWSRVVVPSVTFDGSNELRIEETMEIF